MYADQTLLLWLLNSEYILGHLVMEYILNIEILLGLLYITSIANRHNKNNEIQLREAVN